MSSKLLKIGFLGGGKMAQAMCKGFIAAGLTKPEAIISSVHPSDLINQKAVKELGAEMVTENIPVVEKSEIVIISVKPNVIPTILEEIKASKIDLNKLFISIAMGVSTKTLEQNLPRTARVIRAMPNTPALVKSGASVYVRGSNVTEADVTVTKKLFQSIGICEEANEYMMDAVTALSGSGPAYVFLFIEALADGGVKMGLPRDLAYKLAAQTVLGAAQMVRDTKQHPGQLKDDVTSPGGTTAAGIHFLEAQGFRGCVMGTVEAAAKRSIEVSQSESGH